MLLLSIFLSFLVLTDEDKERFSWDSHSASHDRHGESDKLWRIVRGSPYPVRVASEDGRDVRRTEEHFIALADFFDGHALLTVSSSWESSS